MVYGKIWDFSPLGELVIYKDGTYKYGTMFRILVLMESSEGRTSYFGSVIFFVCV
jgi:hypothetical protein